ncbi:MAG: serine hydrolase domain-containing protein [Bacteroidota bacterium]
MKPSILPLLLLALSLLACQPQAPSTTTTAPPAQTEAFQAILDSMLQQHPGMTGLMAHVEAPEQGISWSGAAGKQGPEKGQPLRADQPVLIASNTKTYVSVSILRLVEMGKVKLDQPIGALLSDQTRELLITDGYDLEGITVAHLLSHTGGVFNYVDAEDFFGRMEKNPKHRWTRDEQIALAISAGEPLGKAGALFKYADTNYLLLTEIIEQLTGQPFYEAMKELMAYERHGLTATWFHTLEPAPQGVKPLAYQYVGSLSINSYQLDASYDLYGGGGLAATSKDLARFSQLLFEGKFFEKPETLDLIYTKMPTEDQQDSNYLLGLSSSKVKAMQSYGHGGYWGTTVKYIPELNASIAIFILERDERKYRPVVMEAIVGQL